ncbi:MAG TPA: hypothetical protein VGA18_05635, partial [Rhodothermales bacterium]
TSPFLLLWTEAHPGVPVVNGVFNVDLGSIVSLLDLRFDRAYEIGISVDGDPEISPRTPLTAVPYAVNLAGALRVQIVDDDVDVFASDNIIGGNGFVDADAVGVTVSGGGNTDDFEKRNRGYGNYGTIGGGWGNAVGGNDFTATEPIDNPFATVGGGYRNEAFGAYSTIPGGYVNRTNGSFGFAAGYRAISDHRGSFVWSDSSGTNFTSTGDWQFLIRAKGGVGIGTAAPTNMLHVVESTNGAASAANHVALIDNSSTGTSSDVLALRIGRASQPETSNVFISFLYSGTAAGVVRGNGGGGVEYASTGSDYAELLERADPSETIEPGDVVAVSSGKISLHSDKVDRHMVITDRSAVLGNMPDPENEHLFERVAFVGQVPVKIRGPVSSGDFVLPSGLHDGVARAVAPESISIDDIGRIIGRAWESSDQSQERKVLIEVGLDQSAVVKSVLQAYGDRIERLERLVQQFATDRTVGAP